MLERREVRPQLGLLKSTMLQLDSSFSERAYGAGSFTDFIERLRKSDLVQVTGGEGRYMIQRKRTGAPEKTVRPEEALPALRDVLENHRLEMEEGVSTDDLLGWVHEESPEFDWKQYGFQEFSEFLNYAQDKTVVRIEPDEETQSLLIFLGAEFHPPAIPEPEPIVCAGGTGRGDRRAATGRSRSADCWLASGEEGYPESGGGDGRGWERHRASETSS